MTPRIADRWSQLNDLSILKNITDADLMHLNGLPPEYLCLRSSRNLTDIALKALEDCKNLTQLDLTDCKFTGSGLDYLKNLQHLTSLSLDWCDNLSDIGFSHLGKLSSLKYLSLRECQNLSYKKLNCLTELSLTHLEMSNCELKDTGSIKFKSDTLTKLEIDGCDITDATLEHLKNCPNLDYLDLSYIDTITDIGLAHLAELKHLTYLDITECDEITDEGVAYFQSRSNVKNLIRS